MKTKFALSSLFLIITLTSVSQIVPNSQRATAKLEHANNVYLEFLGSGISYSLNYERMYRSSSTLYFTSRVGFGMFENYYSIPVHASAMFGLFGGKFEVGGSLNFLTPNSNASVSKNEVVSTESRIMAQPIIGFRYQPHNKGLMFRVMFTPIFDKADSEGNTLFDTDLPFIPWGGMSVGYHF